MSADASPILRARDLACRRGGRLVFAGLDAELAPGGALILRGRNGSGKTSLLRLLAGLGVPAAGSLSWAGTPVAELGELYRMQLHFAGHAIGLKPALTVRDNLAFWARFLGGTPERVDSAIEAFAIAPLAGVPAGRLSAGQQKRTALARLLLADRPLWLLDEPTVALDAEAQSRLLSILAQHVAAGGMAAIATHAPLDLPGETLDLSPARAQAAAASADAAQC